MIFVTIGTVFPFDRLIKAMDDFAADTGTECLAQIGNGHFKPTRMAWHASVPGDVYKRAVREAEVIVSHAGMGSVITALQSGTPIVIMPRRLEAGEHTTDHQMATARWLEDKPGIFVAWDESELASQISAAKSSTVSGAALPPHAPSDFTDRLRAQLSEWIA